MRFSIKRYFNIMTLNVELRLRNKRNVFFLSVMMLCQNIIFFLIWVLFFSKNNNINGWGLQHIAMMYALVSSSCGFVLFFFDGVRTIGDKINNGSIDSYLLMPCHPLIVISLSRSSPAALGDLLSAIFYWVFFAKVSLYDIPEIMLLTMTSTVIFFSVLVIFYSLGFWLKSGGRLADQLYDVIVAISSIPQQFPVFYIKALIYTILPSAFITIIPINTITNNSYFNYPFLFFVSTIYLGVSLIFFNCGVRKYKGQTS